MPRAMVSRAYHLQNLPPQNGVTLLPRSQETGFTADERDNNMHA